MTEKQRGKVRVQFVCGGRVLQQLKRKNNELVETSKLLSVQMTVLRMLCRICWKRIIHLKNRW